MASATAASAATSPAALSDLHSKLGNAAVQKMAVEPTTLVPTQTVAPAAIGQTVWRAHGDRPGLTTTTDRTSSPQQ